MFPLLKYIFRKKALKEFSSGIRTGMLPLSSLQRITVLLDAEDPLREKCVIKVRWFFMKHGIKPDIFFLDTRKRGKPLTDPVFTFMRRDLNWYGRLNRNMLTTLLSSPQDLYICLADRTDYPVRFISAALPAKFKIGCTDIKNDIFNIVVSSSSADETSYERFREISKLLEAIKQ